MSKKLQSNGKMTCAISWLICFWFNTYFQHWLTCIQSVSPLTSIYVFTSTFSLFLHKDLTAFSHEPAVRDNWTRLVFSIMLGVSCYQWHLNHKQSHYEGSCAINYNKYNINYTKLIKCFQVIHLAYIFYISCYAYKYLKIVVSQYINPIKMLSWLND